jgi:hypothetical protein
MMPVLVLVPRQAAFGCNVGQWRRFRKSASALWFVLEK